MSLVHGPFVGPGDDPTTGAVIWFRYNSDEYVHIEYGTDSGLAGSSTTSTVAVATATNDGINTITLSGLTANTTYYYRPVGDSSGAYGTINSFDTFPTSLVNGEIIAFGSCFSVDETAATPAGNAFAHINTTLGAKMLVHMGDWIYAENLSTDWDTTNVTDPTLEHYRIHFRNTAANSAFRACCGNVMTTWMPSDHDVFSDWPDIQNTYGSYTPTVTDDPTTHSAYANANTAIGYYLDNWAAPPNAGSNRYGSLTIGNDIFVFLDTRTLRRRQLGKMLGDTQKAWFIAILEAATASDRIFVFAGDTFCGSDTLGGDGWGTNTTSLPVGYIAERDQLDSAMYKSLATCYVFGGDFHAGAHVISKGGNRCFSASPFDDTNQGNLTTPLARATGTEVWTNDTTTDNRWGTIVFNANGTITVNIYRGNSGGSETPSVEETWTSS